MVKTIWRHLIVVGLLSGALVATAVPAQAGTLECSERFPTVAWEEISSGDVSVSVAGVPGPMATRFAREIALAESWLVQDVGPFETSVCLVGNDLRSIGDEFVSGSRQFHAHQDLEDRFLILDVQRPGFVAPAAAFALAHQALWQNNGDAAFPEPIASVIAYWYRARILDRMEYYHRDVMVENFFDTEAVIDWGSSFQESVQDWNPETNFRAIADFVDFAVATYGTEVLLETDPTTWSRIEGEWRTSLRADLTGRDTPTTDWLVGVAVAVGIIAIAIAAIALGLISKYRRRTRIESSPPIPGFFSER